MYAVFFVLVQVPVSTQYQNKNVPVIQYKKKKRR